MVSYTRIENGFASGIVTTSQQIVTSDIRAESGIEIKAHVDNSGVVYIGNSGVNITNGFPLRVVAGIGESIFIPTRRPSDLYVIGDASSTAGNTRIHYFII